MDLRELVRRLEKIEKHCQQNKDKDTESMVGVLIDDLIEQDMEAEKAFREEVKEFIDKTIEEKVVERAMYSGSIAQAQRGYMERFQKNGGYIVKKETIFPFAENVRYMDCSCGRQVRNVGEDCESVRCSRCVDSNHYKQFADEYKEKRQRKSTGRPAGWHFMNEFVDKDGNVFHKGKEQPKLKGTLEPTKVKPKKKVKRKTRDEILVARHKEKLKAQRKLNKDLEKQRKFLMGDVEK